MKKTKALSAEPTSLRLNHPEGHAIVVGSMEDLLIMHPSQVVMLPSLAGSMTSEAMVKNRVGIGETVGTAMADKGMDGSHGDPACGNVGTAFWFPCPCLLLCCFRLPLPVSIQPPAGDEVEPFGAAAWHFHVLLEPQLTRFEQGIQ